MSINWVMLHPTDGFTLLPGEQRLWASPPRTSLLLHSLNKFPGKLPFSLSASSGRVHLTNQRVIYLPNPQTPALQSFAAPLARLNDSHMTAPWFGPNEWIAAVQPVQDGGIPPTSSAVELKLTFRDGGAYDFHSKFLEIKERVAQAQETAGGSESMRWESVHLDQLPTYEESSTTTAVPVALSQAARQQRIAPATTARIAPPSTGAPPARSAPPDEPPPGYDEAQPSSLVERLERVVSEGSGQR